MAATTVVPLTKKSQEALIKLYQEIQNLASYKRKTQRARFERIDIAYQREVDKTDEHRKAQEANRAGNPKFYQNMTVPIVMTQVEAGVVYQTSVFLTGTPLFGVVAAPEFLDESIQMESVIDEQSVKGGWVGELMEFFRDGYKYNFAPIEVVWKQEVSANLETNLGFSATEAKPTETIWTGNAIRSLDVYNTFVDPRPDPVDVPKKGEFGGYTESMSRMELKQFIAALPDKITANIRRAFESGIGSSGVIDSSSQYYYTPSINPDTHELETQNVGTNWDAWAGLAGDTQSTIRYKNNYEVTTLYVRILPGEFDIRVPSSMTPQVWKLIIVNHEVIIYSERQTNAHQLLPILIAMPLRDKLRYQTKALAEHSEGFQSTATSFMASIMASRRRAISDRVLYDPSRITSAQMNNPNPSAKIPVKPAAYGKKISDSVFHFPYNEDQAGVSMQQIGNIIQLANNLVGQNPARQGQFVKGNKTQKEFESVMDNANGRDQMTSILLETQFFTPLKQILKINILQFQGGTTIYNRDKEVAVEIDPVKLRKAVLQFKISDGLTPKAKLMNADLIATTVQVIGSSPQIAAGYNVAPMFSYLMKGQGAELTAFEKSPEQMAFEQAMGQWQQVAALAIEKGVDPEKLPPAPVPATYGYDPTGQSKEPGKVIEGESTREEPGVQ